MDGLIEPSMPKMPSLQGIKDDEEDEPGRNRGSNEDDGDMPMFGGDKRKFSVGAPAGRKTEDLDKQMKKAMIGQKVALSAKQKKDIADAFNAFDVPGTGYMSTVDLRVALRALGFEARKQDMKKILEVYDKGDIGRLCYSDFMSIIESKLSENDTKDDLCKVFKLFDKDQTGHITFQNLRQVADELGENINDEELAEMIAEADQDDDGTLKLDEFMNILKKASLY